MTGVDEGPSGPGHAGRTGPWPPDAAVAGLVAGPGGEASPREAVAAADRAARGHRALLVNLADPGDDLDRQLDAGDRPGLRDLRGGGTTLRELAHRPADHGFLYLPAGRGEPGGGGTPLAGDPRILGLLAKVAERVREGDGRLLLYLGRRESWPAGPGQLVDVVIPLAGGGLPSGTPDGIPVLGEHRPEGETVPAREPSAGEPSAGRAEREEPGETGDAGTGSWRRHRRSSGAPLGRIALGVAVLAVLAGAWWWLARQASPASAGPGGQRPAATDASPPDGAAEPGGRATRDASPAGRGELLAAAPELPYSVLIASYAQRSQARERLERWGGEDPGAVYFSAPTRVRGRLYWRLFAGAFPDREAAEGLMTRLVEEGRKDRARSWDVRPVRRAFRAGVYGGRDSAAARVEGLREAGLPAYVLAAADGDTVWQVYLGAYRSADEAAPLERRLREAEVEAELVIRRGESEIR